MYILNVYFKQLNMIPTLTIDTGVETWIYFDGFTYLNFTKTDY